MIDRKQTDLEEFKNVKEHAPFQHDGIYNLFRDS
jgi:hypothetical protein